MSTWFKHPRDLRGSFDPNPSKDVRLLMVYLYLVEMANWVDSAKLKTGQLQISETKIQEACPLLTSQDVRTSMETLSRSGRIVIEKSVGTKRFGSIITIPKWLENHGFISTYDLNCANKTRIKRELTPPESLTNVDDGANDLQKVRESVTKQLKKKNKNTTYSLSESESKEDNLSYLDLATEWNKRLPNHTQVNLTILRKNDKRKSDIRKSIEKHSSELLISAIDKISSSDFLCGKNDRNWKPELPWIIKTENLQKVIEGKYENKDKQQDKRAFLK
jgi:hypothetical protein